jgi:CheY-like chemotaxis protein
MARNVYILDHKGSPWFPFFEEFFEDTSSKAQSFYDAQRCGSAFDQKAPNILFFNSELLSPPFIQKIKVLQQSTPDFRLFHLGEKPKMTNGLQIDEIFDAPHSLNEFQKKLTQKLVYPEVIQILVIDDEAEIGTMLQEFLENRTAPSFKVDYTDDGEKGLGILEQKKHDILILDVKMPIKDGREVYREVKRRKLTIPVIIYFDAISGEEIVEIHQTGRPAVVEKGSRQSSMLEMVWLIKKMVYFG